MEPGLNGQVMFQEHNSILGMGVCPGEQRDCTTMDKTQSGCCYNLIADNNTNALGR